MKGFQTLDARLSAARTVLEILFLRSLRLQESSVDKLTRHSEQGGAPDREAE